MQHMVAAFRSCWREMDATCLADSIGALLRAGVSAQPAILSAVASFSSEKLEATAGGQALVGLMYEVAAATKGAGPLSAASSTVQELFGLLLL